MRTHPPLADRKSRPQFFRVTRTREGNRMEREKERVERKVEVGGASVAPSATRLCLFRPPGFIGADNREGAGDVALATY